MPRHHPAPTDVFLDGWDALTAPTTHTPVAHAPRAQGADVPPPDAWGVPDLFPTTATIVTLVARRLGPAPILDIMWADGTPPEGKVSTTWGAWVATCQDGSWQGVLRASDRRWWPVWGGVGDPVHVGVSGAVADVLGGVEGRPPGRGRAAAWAGWGW